MRVFLTIQALFLLTMASLAQAQSDPITTAKRAAQMLDAAATQLSEAQKSSDRVAALTSTVRAYEEGLSALREGLRRVAVRERAINIEFEAKEDRLSRLLGVLQTIGRSPAPLLMMHPSGAIGTARSGMILSDVTPALQSEALQLKTQLEEVSVLRSLQESAATQLVTALENIQTARATLAQAVADRTDLPDRVITDPAQMAALIDSADTLQGFADGLTELSSGSANPADFETAKGKLPLPANGIILQGFNEVNAQGTKRPGLTVALQSQSLVTAPWPATVRYAGPLLDYGSVVILEPGKGYLLILAGLGAPLVKEGQIVSDGEALAMMGGNLPDADAFLINAAKGGGGNRQESLYIELRQGDTPTNPADWFVVDRE
ncbi:peptidoglycan DD-metalloendopeptidase family protein [uncultured Litoreibacter sp.]|uniref:murein hydrolase activator EnvC family protein n=1 Tax=uncultured Litoreibacter sp. TaxID=1392394 RepID=UPI002629D1CA|nr:peptidoglycan DD-metalloendopeptidase family protein [uncultured Litoreibacter sp.]